MKITFESPISVGDLSSRIEIKSLELVSLSINLLPGREEVLVSITMRDPATDYYSHWTCEDSVSTPEFAATTLSLPCSCCSKPWPQHLLERLISEGKLPTGTITSSSGAVSPAPGKAGIVSKITGLFK